MPRPISPARSVGHQAPAFATVFTAVTMRSRSSSDSEGCTGKDSTSRAACSVCGRSRVQRERRQPMVGDRVVHAGADAVLFLERLGEPVTVVAHADRVLVVDVGCAARRPAARSTPSRCWSRKRAFAWRCSVQPGSFGQLDSADGGVHVGHPGVEAHDLVLVPPLHALVTQQPRSPSDLLGRARDHAAFDRGHVLRRVQAEHRERAEDADRRAMPGGAMGLRRVLEQLQPVPLRDGVSPVRSAGCP